MIVWGKARVGTGASPVSPSEARRAKQMSLRSTDHANQIKIHRARHSTRSSARRSRRSARRPHRDLASHRPRDRNGAWRCWCGDGRLARPAKRSEAPRGNIEPELRNAMSSVRSCSSCAPGKQEFAVARSWKLEAEKGVHHGTTRTSFHVSPRQPQRPDR
jgi:hypothetical protein